MRVTGVLMALFFSGLMMRFWHHNKLTDADRQWLKRIRDVIANRDEGLPEVGKYRLMRDPHLCQAPDGLWHLVWTSDWFGPVIGHATSRDLMHWSKQQTIPVMTAFAGVRNSWAPETVNDPKRQHALVIGRENEATVVAVVQDIVKLIKQSFACHLLHLVNQQPTMTTISH